MPNKRTLFQATFDGVVERATNRVMLVDPNRRPDGPLIHTVNSNGVYLRAFQDRLRDIVNEAGPQIENIHFAGKRGWTRTNYGWTYEAMFRFMVDSVAKPLGLTSSFKYALDSINVQNGTVLRGPDNRRTMLFNYTDTEVSQTEDQINKDFRVLARLMKNPEYMEMFSSVFINWPTGNWMPHPANVPGLLRKSDFYSDLDSVGRKLHNFTVLTETGRDIMIEQVMDFAERAPPGKGIVVKPNVAGLRALGVYLLNPDGKNDRVTRERIEEVVDDILDPMHTGTSRIKEWLVEEEIDRDYISYLREGTRYRIYYDLIPMIVGHEPVSTYAKYSVVKEGERMQRMPGQHPVIFAFLGIENERRLPVEISKWEEQMEPYMAQLHERSRSDGLKPQSILGRSGVEEGPESDIVREYLKGSGLIEAAEFAAIDAKMVLEERLDDQLATLRTSLLELRR